MNAIAAGSRMPWSKIVALVVWSGDSAVESVANASKPPSATAATRSGDVRARRRRRTQDRSATAPDGAAGVPSCRATAGRGDCNRTPSASTATNTVWKMTWMGPTVHDTWATSKIGVRSITARNAGHGLVTVYQATAAARSGTTPAMARAGTPAWMSYGACWLRAATPRTARDATAAATMRTKSRLRRLVGLVRPSIANVGSSLGTGFLPLVARRRHLCRSASTFPDCRASGRREYYGTDPNEAAACPGRPRPVSPARATASGPADP